MSTMRDIQAAMAVGTDRYSDVIGALTAIGLPTVFTQTGGMCAALEVTLETGQHLLITDAENSLAWNRDEHAGWAVGRYRLSSEYDDGPVVFLDTDASDVRALIDLVKQVLCSAAPNTGARGGQAD